MSISVLAPGLFTTVQDGGRNGCAALGVGRAGAMDITALRLANILVGNVENAAALEITLRGPHLRFDHDSLIGLTGATIQAHCNGEAVPLWRPATIRAGSELVLGGMPRGARSYLAVAGGIDAARVLGSCSSDINAGIGARALAAGDVLDAWFETDALKALYGFDAVVGFSDKHAGVNNRTAAYMLALDRVASAIRTRGLYA